MSKFLWGAATSAYQVEGGIKNDWSVIGLDAGLAVNHYNFFEEDFDLAKSLGHNAHRFSIEWSRIEPEEGKFDQKEIEHYRRILIALRERGLEPVVTLWHFTNPIWFSELGGFKNEKSAEYFSRYVDFVTKNLKDFAVLWITLNEPMVYAGNSYYRGIWPPKENLSLISYFKVINNLIKSHQSAYKVVHQNIPLAQVGISKDNIYFDEDSHIWHFLNKWSEYWWNHYFLDKIFDSQDFIGLNYYFHKHVRELGSSVKEAHLKSDLGWAIDPEGLYYVLKDLRKYQKPVYITENGIADAKDEKRAQFIKDHIGWMKKAIQEGIDIRGYFYWSLLDNFEWDKGFEPRFGLIEVGRLTMERKIRQSAYIYKDIIEEEII